MGADAGGPPQPFSIAFGPARLHSALDDLRDVNGFVMGKRRTVLLVVVGVLVASAYGLLLYAVTEPWRVYGNDYLPFFWAIPAFLGTAAVAIVSIRWPRWRPLVVLVVLLVPLFFISRQQIINRRLTDCVTSCGNHSAFWGSWEFDGDTPLPSSTEFAEFLVTSHKDEPLPPLHGMRCPGYKRAGTRTGVVFVGGGLRLASLADKEVLVAFCSWKCHPVPYDHQHCLVWEWGDVNGTYRGIFARHCSETKDMIGRIQRALEQANQGLVPYSREACTLLRDELQKRKTRGIQPITSAKAAGACWGPLRGWRLAARLSFYRSAKFNHMLHYREIQ